MATDNVPLQASFCVLATSNDDGRDGIETLGLLIAEPCIGVVEETSTDSPPPAVPIWKPDVRELWYMGELVKKFKQPAPSQEMILAAFQEGDWPPHILDPLPPRPDGVPSQRLRATIRNLNAHQKNPLLRFESDGHGEGICWYSRQGE